jgi:hypothetical protein
LRGAAQTPPSVVKTSGITKGNAAAALGKDLVHTGSAVIALTRNYKERGDQRVGTDIYTAAADEAGAFMGGLMAREGPAALPDPTDPDGSRGKTQGVTRDARKAFGEIFERHAEGLTKRQREIAGKKFAEFAFPSYKTLAFHEAAETVKAEQSTNKNEQESLQRHAIANFADAGAVAIDVLKIEKLIEDDPYITGAKKEEEKAERRAKIYSTTTEMVAGHSYADAMDLLVDYAEDMGPELSNEVLRKINVHRVDKMAPGIIANALKRWRRNGGDFTIPQIREGLREKYENDPILQTELIKRWESATKLQRDQERRARDIDNEARWLAAKKHMARGELMSDPSAYEDARTEIRLSNDPDYVKDMVEEVNRLERGEDKTTEWIRYKELLALSTAEIQKINPDREPLAKPQRDKLISLIEEAIAGKTTVKKAQGASFTRLVNKMAEKNHLDGPNTELFTERLEEEMQDWLDDTGQPANAVQRRQIANSLMATTQFNAWHTPNKRAFQFDNDDIDAFTVAHDDFNSVDLIPLTDRYSIRQNFLRVNKREPTRAEVLSTFKRTIIAKKKELRKAAGTPAP